MSDMTTTGSGTSGAAQERASEVAGASSEQAGQVASTAKEQAASVASSAGEQAKAVAGDAREQARRIVDDGRRQLRDQAGEQSQRAASGLRDLGDQIHRLASGQGAPEGPVADLARQAADGVQRVAESLENRRPEDLLADLRRFARERPGVFVLGALGAGFAAGRLLRAVDTSSLTEAAKSGAGVGDTGGSPGGGSSTFASSTNVAPAGTVGQVPGLVPGAGAAALGAADPLGAGDPLAGDALAAGMVGTTPADLVEDVPASRSRPAATER